MSVDEMLLTIPPELEQTLQACSNLPSLPAIALKIIDASKDPDISLHDVSAIISADPAISAKLLKIANSPLYSRRRSLSNLREALTLLGFNASLTIALSFSLLHSLGGDSASHDNFWKRSILSAAIARLLGAHLRVTKLEDLFLASLLQDIGILVLQCLQNESGGELEFLTHHERVVAEEESHNANHSHVGAWLLQNWNLPDYLVKSVLFSHSLNIKDKDQTDDDKAFHYCLNLSGNLADIWLNNNPGELLLSIKNVLKEVLGVDSDGLNDFLVEIDNYLPEISNMFDISLVENNLRENILHEARELLLERSIDYIKKAEDDRRYIDHITSRVEKIEEESRIDHLTRAYNRQYIETLLNIEFKEASKNKWPLSLAFIDIDDFKLINDSHGHLIGDDILKLISKFFSDNIRESDVLARYGGDEFLLMLPGANSVVAKQILERLIPLLDKNIVLDVKGKSLSASVSIGLATHMDKNKFSNLKSFMSAADDALYKSKSKGKNCLSVY